MGGCGCGSAGCGGPPACTDPCPSVPRETAFTVQSAQSFSSSLSRLLVGVADRLRDLATRFGQRPYNVWRVRTRFSGGARGFGEEAILGEPERILPTPLVLDLVSLKPIVSPVGVDEVGGCMLTEISGCYTEEQLRGIDNLDGTPIPADQGFYYDIEFLRADGIQGERRRFNVTSVPAYIADDFGWQLRLERARPDRVRASGAPR